MTDTDYYDSTESDVDDDEVMDSESFDSVEPNLDTIYNLSVVDIKRAKFTNEEGDMADVEQFRFNVTLAIDGGEFDGEPSYHTFWMGPWNEKARKPQHKRARKSFNKFFEACTGEKIGKGSTVDYRDCVGSSISAKWVSAAYERDGVTQREGEAKWDDFSWAPPIEQYDDDDYDDEDPV